MKLTKTPLITIIPCCGYKVKEEDIGPVYWNPYNKMVQCHNCGKSYQVEPATKASPAEIVSEQITNAVRASVAQVLKT